MVTGFRLIIGYGAAFTKSGTPSTLAPSLVNNHKMRSGGNFLIRLKYVLVFHKEVLPLNRLRITAINT